MTDKNDIPGMAAVPAELRSYMDSFTDPKILLDGHYRIIAANSAYQREFGGGGEVEGRCCYELSHHYDQPCDQAGEYCPLRDCMESGTPQRVLHVHFTSAGQEHVEVEMKPVNDDTGSAAYYMETMRILRHAHPPGEGKRLVGHSRAFTSMLALAKRVAEREASVLLLGESGTGKELVAQAIHDMSPRAEAPFVVVECSGLTEALFESELFGYEKGAFTGAISRKIGLAEAVQGGTLFLDEVGDIPLALQVKLLRLLEAGTFRRVGGLEPLRADFRLVAATHRDLRAMVREGSFREDLYFRINVFPIRLPSLRERIEDLPLLAAYLLSRLEPRRHVTLSDEAMALLKRYAFPGNIRELRNLLERALIMLDGTVIERRHLPDEVLADTTEKEMPETCFQRLLPLEEMERNYLTWAVHHFSGERQELARQLGVSERTLYRKLRDLGEQTDEA